MEMTGEHRISAPREKVWEALNDPEVLARCIPGCQELTRESDTALSATVKSRVGPVSATFVGKVTLSEMDPPNSYRISGEGQGGVAGFAKGGARIELAEDGADTVLSYTATAQVGGKLAQIGSRLIDTTAKKMAGDFFDRFVAEVADAALAEEEEKEEEDVPEVVPLDPEPPAEASQQTTGLSPKIWVGGLIAAVVIVLILLQM